SVISPTDPIGGLGATAHASTGPIKSTRCPTFMWHQLVDRKTMWRPAAPACSTSMGGSALPTAPAVDADSVSCSTSLFCSLPESRRHASSLQVVVMLATSVARQDFADLWVRSLPCSLHITVAPCSVSPSHVCSPDWAVHLAL